LLEYCTSFFPHFLVLCFTQIRSAINHWQSWKNAAKQKVESKTQQREDALDMYHSNLNESSAQVPDQLNRDNKQRLKDLNELYVTTTKEI